jgi:hypothetical protein
VFALYLPLSLFAIWYNVTTFWIHRAIRHENGTDAAEYGEPLQPTAEPSNLAV